MNASKHFLLGLLLISPAFADSKFYTDAGIGYAALTGANYATGPVSGGLSSLSSVVSGTPAPTSTFTVLNEDKSKWTPFVAAGYVLTDFFSVRLSYQYIGSVTANAKATLFVGGDVRLGDVAYRFDDNVHVLGLAPELKWPASRKCSITLAPEVNWVASRGEIIATTSSPSIDIAPRLTRNERAFSAGISVGTLWKLADNCDFSLGYKYTKLKPSWGREAHLISGGLRWHF